jgi:hypothetical protein
LTLSLTLDSSVRYDESTRTPGTLRTNDR